MKELFKLELTQTEDICLENTCRGDILISPTTEGKFYGAELNGMVLPLGMGCTFTPYSGKNDIETRMLLQMNDGAKVLMEMQAYLDLDEEVEQRMINDKPVNASEYYYKGIVRFQTGDPKYRWLERKVCVCSGEIESWEKLVFTMMLF